LSWKYDRVIAEQKLGYRFQILVEIAASEPDIHQKSFAAKLAITRQAVSDYIRQMLDEEMLVSTGRTGQRISVKVVNWVYPWRF
jgi:putative transcriptional regulator